MCDILAISAATTYTPQQYLPIFAEKGKRNINGWGIGFFRDHQAHVEKSAERVYHGDQVHESFQRLARVIDSRIIVSHLSCPLGGGRHVAHNHPFFLYFLDHHWLFVHVGVVDNIEDYQSFRTPPVDAAVYPARIFEFIRDQILTLTEANPYLALAAALRNTILQLTMTYPGNYTFFLANESVLFAFTNFRPLMLLRTGEEGREVLLLTSVAEGLSQEPWLELAPAPESLGKLIIVAGSDLLYLEDVQ